MNSQPSQPKRRLPAKGWVVILPTLIILAVVLLLTETTSAAPSPAHPRVASNQLTFQEQQPLCQTCHPDEYNVWKDSTHAQATLDPVFQAELAKSHNQDDCLKCHTTGFDTGSGKFMSEGVTCEACHGAYKKDHPAGQTMTLPIDAETCRMCHEAAFSEWETSQHAAQKIECFDCHQAHTQGLRTGSAETLCAACHTDEQTKLAHSVHGISGVDCGSCHMAKGMKDTVERERCSDLSQQPQLRRAGGRVQPLPQQRNPSRRQRPDQGSTNRRDRCHGSAAVDDSGEGA